MSPQAFPLFHFIFWLVITVLLVEFGVILLSGIIAIILQVFLNRFKGKREKLFEDASALILLTLTKQETLTLDQLDQTFQKDPYTLLDLLEQIDLVVASLKWEKMKRGLIEAKALSIVPSLLKKDKITKTLLAVRILGISPHPSDKEQLLQLLGYPLPLVFQLAGITLVRIGAIKEVVEKMNTMEHFERYPFRDAIINFLTMDHLYYLKQRLEKEREPYLKVVLWELLTDRGEGDLLEYVKRDLQSEHLNLRIAVLRFVAAEPLEFNHDFLIPLLDNEKWEIRLQAAKVIEKIKLEEAVPKLVGLLEDEQWWVRLHAALALKSIGGEAKRFLELQDPDIDHYAYDVSRLVLRI